MNALIRTTPGGLGIPARWTSSAKAGIGTALGEQSYSWFTLSHGIFNEIYLASNHEASIAKRPQV